MKRALIVVLVIVVIAIAGFYLRATARGFSTRQPPTVIEALLARGARHWAVPSDARAQANPEPNRDKVLAEARAHWADHCATCHANDGSGDTAMGRNLYPRAPDMRAAATQNLSDGELFFIIQNGIRLTGMPAWGTGTGHDAEDSWKLVRFIRHLPSVTPQELQEMSKMNPKSPADLEEEKAEEDFLNGGNPQNAPEHQHHHH